MLTGNVTVSAMLTCRRSAETLKYEIRLSHTHARASLQRMNTHHRFCFVELTLILLYFFLFGCVLLKHNES